MLQPFIIGICHALLHAFHIFSLGLGLHEAVEVNPGMLRGVTRGGAEEEV